MDKQTVKSEAKNSIMGNYMPIGKFEMVRFENMYSYMREPVETMKRFKANGTFKNILNPSPVFYQNQQPQVQSKGLDIIRQPNNSIMFEHS